MNLRSITLGALLLAATACGAQSLDDGAAKAGPDGRRTPGGTTVTLDQAPADDKAAAIVNAVTPDQALAAKVPDAVRAEGLKVTTSVGYPPMELFASDGKTPIGLDPALARAIARKLGVKVTISDEDFNAQIPGVITGRYDMIMSSMSDTPERQAKVTFVDYVRAGAGMILKAGNPAGVKGPADLCGRTVSVVDNGSSLELAETYDKDCGKAGKSGVTILKFPGDQEALLQVRNGRAQANITDYVVAAYKAADPGQKVEALAVDGTESPWGIGMNPKDEQLVECVRGALDALIASGEYGGILKAWSLEKLAVPSAVVNGGK
ncbi:ABC transporter substrate-binding protein [Nonomuraea roseoviolacea subsp. roseoviolacea]|uniref:Polar amino acid transport system substrate-binding protein n=1 Tax=Nonomuraea roseoviolacea subsp. carminata TaxID=160689 RepID=A0ABT1KBK3_9ACTN|nr:ABC transporter substrate-binding protein [Nonomuraea roseoviolacea]MCP2351072.1 polar amino acid transport system substrate-binding protein [Nonomuraea roseoviolacea subsp. carminata]